MDKKELDNIGKEISKEAPGLIRGPIHNGIQKFIDLDINKDGVSDLLQAINLLDKALPVLVALNEAIDFEQLAADLAKSPAVKDHAKFTAALVEAGKLVEAAQKLTGK